MDNGRPRYRRCDFRRLARADQVGPEEIRTRAGENLLVSLGLHHDPPTAVPQLDRLVHRALHGRGIGQEEVVLELVGAARRLDAEPERDVPRDVHLRVQQPEVAYQVDVAQSVRAHLVARRVGIEPRMRAVRKRQRQGQAQPIGEPVGHAEVERVDVEVQRLPERRSGLVHLRADIPLVSREATVRHADLPLARPDETVSLSAQTGGCEAHGHSALPERLRGRSEDASHDAKRRQAPALQGP